MDLDILRIDNFIKPGICDKLAEFRANHTTSFNNAQEYFEGKSYPYANITDPLVKYLVQEIKYEVRARLSDHYLMEVLYPEFTDLVKWSDGDSLDLHADNAFYPSGDPNYCAWRTYSAIIALNDDYKGGETFFNDGPTIGIEKGSLLGFKGDIEYAHGVHQVKGTRYTLAMWFTDDALHIEH